MEVMSISWIIPGFLVSFDIKFFKARKTQEKEAHRHVSLQTFWSVISQEQPVTLLFAILRVVLSTSALNRKFRGTLNEMILVTGTISYLFEFACTYSKYNADNVYQFKNA